MFVTLSKWHVLTIIPPNLASVVGFICVHSHWIMQIKDHVVKPNHLQSLLSTGINKIRSKNGRVFFSFRLWRKQWVCWEGRVKSGHNNAIWAARHLWTCAYVLCVSSVCCWVRRVHSPEGLLLFSSLSPFSLPLSLCTLSPHFSSSSQGTLFYKVTSIFIRSSRGTSLRFCFLRLVFYFHFFLTDLQLVSFF